MFVRVCRFAALALALVLPATAPAADSKADGPSLLIRVQSVSDIIKTVEYFATFVPKDNPQVGQLNLGLGVIKDLVKGDSGIEGIDTKNPIGFYASLASDVQASPVVVLIPVADEKAVLNALKTRANIEPKEKDGVYEVASPGLPMTIYFRFANKYAYITANDPENISLKTLPKPEAVLGGKSESLVSVTARLDRLPADMKKMALGQIEEKLSEGKGQALPNETPAQKAFKDETIDQVTRSLKSLLEDGEEVSFRLNVDPKGGEVGVEFEMTAKKGSTLAKDIASIRDNKSTVGGAIGSPDAAFSLNLSLAMASSLKKLMGPVVDEALAMVRQQIPGGGEEKELAEILLKALTPTAKSGDLDVGLSLLGPNKDGHLTAVVGVKVVEGKKIENAVKEIIKKKGDFAALIDLDAEKLGGDAMLHTIKIGALVPEKGQKVFGPSDLHLTFRDDLMILAFGPEAKNALKKAVNSKPSDVGLTQFQVSLARFVPAVSESADEAAIAKKVAAEVFEKGSAAGSDTITLSLEGGSSLKLKFSAKGKALVFLGKLNEAQMKARGDN